jgi:hypothetical protein
MKRIATLTALLLTAMTAGAQTIPPIVYDIESDFQQTQALPDQSFVQGAGVALRYRLKSQGRWLSLAGLGARWDARALSTSTQALQQAASVVTNVTPHYFQMLLTPAQTGSAVTNWTHSLIVTSGGTEYPIGVGRLDIAASAWTGDAAVLSNTKWTAYTDAAVSSHAAVKATTNSLGHIIVGDNLTVDGNGRVSAAPPGVTAWGDVPGKPFTNLVDLTTDNLTGIDWGLYVTGTPWTAVGYLTAETDPVFTNWLETTPPLYSYTETDPLWSAVSNTVTAGSALGSTAVQPAALAGYVPTNDTRYLAALTNAAAFSPAGALPTTGGIMTGIIQDSFGAASINPSARTLHNSFEDLVSDWDSLTLYNGSVLDPRLNWGLNTLYGIWKSEGTATTGTEIVNYQTATGIVANTLAPYVAAAAGYVRTNHTGNVSISGNITASGAITGATVTVNQGLGVGIAARTDIIKAEVQGRIRSRGTTGTNSPALLLFSAGLWEWGIRGDGNQMTFLQDNTERARITSDGNFLVGQTNNVSGHRLQVTGNSTLTGNLTVSGSVTAGRYSATVTPYLIPYTNNVTISAANGMEQHITSITGAMDITFPVGATNTSTKIFLTIPPYSGTNTVNLMPGPEYEFVSPLVSTNWIGTNAFTQVWMVSEYGTTNRTAVVMRGSVQ